MPSVGPGTRSAHGDSLKAGPSAAGVHVHHGWFFEYEVTRRRAEPEPRHHALPRSRHRRPTTSPAKSSHYPCRSSSTSVNTRPVSRTLPPCRTNRSRCTTRSTAACSACGDHRVYPSRYRLLLAAPAEVAALADEVTGRVERPGEVNPGTAVKAPVGGGSTLSRRVRTDQRASGSPNSPKTMSPRTCGPPWRAGHACAGRIRGAPRTDAENPRPRRAHLPAPRRRVLQVPKSESELVVSGLHTRAASSSLPSTSRESPVGWRLRGRREWPVRSPRRDCGRAVPPSRGHRRRSPRSTVRALRRGRPCRTDGR